MIVSFVSDDLVLLLCGGFFALLLLVWGATRFYRVYVRITNRHLRHWLRAKRGKGFDIDQLAQRLGTRRLKLEMTEARYRQHTISKKRGGTRTLHVPEPSLKAMQRLIHRRLLRKLRTHPAATGFEPGCSIAHNAGRHTGQAVVIKLDVIDFFPSTTAGRVEQYFRRVGWDKDTAALLSKLTNHEGGLPQGAPTSPRLSNLVNFALDSRIIRYVSRLHGTYTRYADDITISFPEDHPRRVRGTIQYIRNICKAHGYTIHTRHKLRILRQHQQQRVNGLVVNDRVNLPRKKRRWLRAVEHRLQTTGEASLTEEQLAGWRAFQHMIETQAGGDTMRPVS